MPELVPASVAVIALGLASATTWGLGDFGAGWLGRRVPLAGVLLGSQVAGAGLSLVLAVAVDRAIPGPADAGWALVSSLFGGFGLACLYTGLARGRMGVVAPVTGVLAAAIPAVAGIILEGALPPAVLAGILLAIASVLVVSRVGETDDGRPSGVLWALGGGIGLGAIAVTLAQISPGLVFGPLALMRLGEAALVAAFVVARRPRVAWRAPRRLLPAVVAVGALDMLGTGFYIAASQAGPLAIAGVLSALYPVATVVLAVAILREPMARWHLAGVAMAAVAIVLITTGAAG